MTAERSQGRYEQSAGSTVLDNRTTENRRIEYHRTGPSVVALGGGHGLAASLKAARHYAAQLTAIVSVGDDGGSSGRLRAEFGVSPPGDIRRCLSALADDRLLLGRSLEYRFEHGELSGHPIGNLLLSGLSLADGNLQQAIDEVGRAVGAVGRVIPATTVPVTLVADSDAGLVTGQVAIERAADIGNLRIDPVDAATPGDAVRAILEADQVVVGPGSLFTSVLAAAVVEDVREALERTSAQRVFVANVADDRAEARGLGLSEHLEALAEHRIPVDLVIADDHPGLPLTSPPPSPRTSPGSRVAGVPVVVRPVAADDGWSHDPGRLAEALSWVLTEAAVSTPGPDRQRAQAP